MLHPRHRAWNVNSGSMEPGIVRALDRITDNLTKVIDAKIATVLEAIKEQTSQLQAAKKRIADVEAVATL